MLALIKPSSGMANALEQPDRVVIYFVIQTVIAYLTGMSLLSVRLPKDLEKKLADEAKHSHKKRAELVREALSAYLRSRQRKRFMDEMLAELKAMTPEMRAEGLQVAEEALPFDNEALDIVEARERPRKPTRKSSRKP